MNLILREDESLESKITVTLTRRDIFLLNLCLQMVERNHAQSGSLFYDIQSLRDKLPHGSEESR